MPDPTTLTEYADHLLATAHAALADARARFNGARVAEAAAKEIAAAAGKALAEAAALASSIRKQLATAATPADAEALAADLGGAVVEQRLAAAELSEAQLAQAEAAGEAKAAANSLKRLTAEAARAAAVAAAEKTAASKRESAEAALSLEPLGTVAATATDILASGDFADARVKVEADIPEPLRAQALAHAGEIDAEGARRRAIDAAVRTSLSAGLEEGGVDGADVPRLRAVLESTDADLRAYVDRAVQRLEAARKVVERLAGGESALGDDQRAAVFDAALEAERGEAVVKEKARDDALAAVQEAVKDLEIASEAFLADDPDGDLAAAEGDETTQVGAAKKAANEAEAALGDADDDYTIEQRVLLTAWRADVPDGAWANFAALAGAQATLTELKADPAALKAASDDAETALLVALLARDRRERRLAYLADAAAARAVGALDYVRNAEALRAQVLRGVAS